jgi:HYR domain
MRKYGVAVACVLAMIVVQSAAGDVKASTGTLNLRAEIPFISRPSECPMGTPTTPTPICHRRTGTAEVPGLGRVTETYAFIVDSTGTGCPDDSFRVLAYPAVLTVAGKGDLNLAVAPKPECIPGPSVPGASPQAFTITGGTGVYLGASGSGTLTRVAGAPGAAVPGVDTWTMTLAVPGLEFDTTAPTITGATSKVVRAPRKAKRVRVSYRVTASDDVDGSVEVTCRPASGTRFRIGRTTVTCSAVDRSGNAAAAKFTITVRRRR